MQVANILLRVTSLHACTCTPAYASFRTLVPVSSSRKFTVLEILLCSLNLHLFMGSVTGNSLVYFVMKHSSSTRRKINTYILTSMPASNLKMKLKNVETSRHWYRNIPHLNLKLVLHALHWFSICEATNLKIHQNCCRGITFFSA